MTAKQKKTSGKSETPAGFEVRLKRLRDRLAECDVEAALICQPVDIRYLTGFVGDDSWLLVRLRERAPVVLSDSRFEEQIAREAPQVKAVMRRQSLADELAKLCSRHRIGRLGVQAAVMTLKQFEAVVKAVGEGAIKAIDDGLVEDRSVKTAEEIRAIRKALDIQQQAYEATLAFIEPGRSERDVAAHLEYQMRLLGADGSSFPTIVAADANAALPHAIPGSKKIRKGGSVLIDWGARWNGYCSDLTRVIGVGKMPAKVREIYAVALEAQEAGIAAIRPGASLKDVDEAARAVIRKAGFGPQFGHSLGHGIGLEIHEQPTLSPRSEGALAPGHVVTVEPGIYLPGVGGVRIEDDVLVTRTGGEVLSRLPKSLNSAII